MVAKLMRLQKQRQRGAIIAVVLIMFVMIMNIYVLDLSKYHQNQSPNMEDSPYVDLLDVILVIFLL
jgi:hypothetical protein